MIVKIINLGEGNASCYKNVTEEQYKFLKELFDDLNANAEAYAPSIGVYEVGEFCVQETEYNEFLHENVELEPCFYGTKEECFAMYDKLKEENPNCWYHIVPTLES